MYLSGSRVAGYALCQASNIFYTKARFRNGAFQGLSELINLALSLTGVMIQNVLLEILQGVTIFIF